MIERKIYWAKDRSKNPHPIICLKIAGPSTIEGAVITSDCGYGNIPMEERYFLREDSNGQLYSIRYKPSYLIRDKFEKYEIDLDQEPYGELSEEGFDFVQEALREYEAYYFPNPIWKK